MRTSQMPKKASKQRSRPPREDKIEAIPSTHPEARDEGPRLLPLRTQRQEARMTGQKYLDLADRALGRDNHKK